MLKLKNVIIVCGLFVGMLATSAAMAQANSDARFRVDYIEIEGNERVTDGTVLAYLPVKIGDQIGLTSLDQAITALFATNLFSDVTIVRDENSILISVQENPIINRINIEGNDVLTDERLLDEPDIQHHAYTRDIAIQAGKKLLKSTDYLVALPQRLSQKLFN